MLCCICKEKEATVHLTQIAGDKMQKVDLCEECAKTKGVNDPTGFSLADLLLVDGNPVENIALIEDPAKNFVVIMKNGTLYKNTLAK